MRQKQLVSIALENIKILVAILGENFWGKWENLAEAEYFASF